MKKVVASTMVFFLFLLTAIPVMAAPSDVKVLVNDKAVDLTGTQPYMKGKIVMLPIRAMAEAVSLKISFDRSSNEIRLYGQEDVAFKVGSNKASNNLNGEVVSFETAAVEKKGRIYVPLAFFNKVLGFNAAYDSAKKQVSILTLQGEAQALTANITDLFNKGEFQKLSDTYFDEELKKTVTVELLSSTWQQVSAVTGPYVAITSVSYAQDATVKELTVITALVAYEKVSLKLTLAKHKQSGKLVGILLQVVPPDSPTPSNLLEEGVTIGEGTPYELGGSLTLPMTHDGKLPAVVLVHGSGPNDRDETAGGYKPFRDLAWGLAEKGIAVLRYDKRTFAYAQQYSLEGAAAALTVKEESVDDAILAAELLKNDSRIDPSRIYIIGHSQGGMLAPRIDAEGGDFAGIISLAGSPRTLWEIIYDQNVAFVAAQEDSDPTKATNKAWIEAELAKAKAIAGLTDTEAKASTAFGIPAYYFKEMDSHSATHYAAKLTKPVLILQGTDDFQVYPDKDYVQWQKLFAGKSNATFKLYPGLNHFFVDYDGPGAGTIDEYSYPGKVSQEVIDDIGKWILKP
ncbi:MAG: alpha/beta fold hydrolase [Candidatus Pristimantibacillus sp.]